MQTAVANFCPSPDHPHAHHNIDDEFKPTTATRKKHTPTTTMWLNSISKWIQFVIPNQLVQLPWSMKGQTMAVFFCQTKIPQMHWWSAVLLLLPWLRQKTKAQIWGFTVSILILWSHWSCQAAESFWVCLVYLSFQLSKWSKSLSPLIVSSTGISLRTFNHFVTSKCWYEKNITSSVKNLRETSPLGWEPVRQFKKCVSFCRFVGTLIVPFMFFSKSIAFHGEVQIHRFSLPNLGGLAHASF